MVWLSRGAAGALPVPPHLRGRRGGLLWPGTGRGCPWPNARLPTPSPVLQRGKAPARGTPKPPSCGAEPALAPAAAPGAPGAASRGLAGGRAVNPGPRRFAPNEPVPALRAKACECHPVSPAGSGPGPGGREPGGRPGGGGGCNPTCRSLGAGGRQPRAPLGAPCAGNPGRGTHCRGAVPTAASGVAPAPGGHRPAVAPQSPAKPRGQQARPPARGAPQKVPQPSAGCPGCPGRQRGC